MGEPTCLIQYQPFSYVAGLPNDSNQGNTLHTLAQSISFGRFVSDSLAWDKWSTFSHNRYVEEAERFSKPGSVAQKKAFFEAHYKNLAARKAAAALLEQANANANANAAATNDPEAQDNPAQHSGIPLLNAVDVKGIDTEERFVCYNNCEKEQVQEVECSSQLATAYNKDLKEGQLMEKPLLKDFIPGRDDLPSRSKKKSAAPSSKSLFSTTSRPSKLPCSPALLVAKKEYNNATPISIDRRRFTPKSKHTPVRESNQITSRIIRKIDNSKDCSTPITTPTTVPVLRETKHPLATTQSESTSTWAKTPLQPSASGSKSIRSKWHFLPTDCSKFMSSSRNKSPSSNLSTPFKLRTEDRATRRKEKLEEKFNSNQSQKAQLQTTLKEKAEAELKKLRQSLCFKARPLPKFYKETRTNQMDKVPLTRQPSPNQQSRTSSSNMVQPTAQRSSLRKKKENTHTLSNITTQINYS